MSVSAVSGISRPRRDRTPFRSMIRLVVTTKRVVDHFTYRLMSQDTATASSARTNHDSHEATDCDATTMAPTITTTTAATGPLRYHQWGRTSTTTSSPAFRNFRGYPIVINVPPRRRRLRLTRRRGSGTLQASKGTRLQRRPDGSGGSSA